MSRGYSSSNPADQLRPPPSGPAPGAGLAARHAGVCWVCEDMVRVGDLIVAGTSGWVHRWCVDDRCNALAVEQQARLTQEDDR